MSQEVSPIFMAFFVAVWAMTVIYVVNFIGMVRLRQTAEGQQAGSLLQALLSGKLYRLDDLRFLFSGDHHQVGDPRLSRQVMITRILFATSGLLILIVFYLVLIGGAADAR